MATSLDLQEQEQLDELKAFWKQYGNLITWVLLLALTAFAGWNGWNWWQRSQATKAAALYEELDRQVQSGDLERSQRAFDDLKERYPRTAQAEQGGLLLAQLQHTKSQADSALASLAWVAEHATQDEYRAVARLRAAGLLLDKKQADAALQQLDAIKDAPSFDALVADRRGDALMMQAKPSEAKAAYQAAWKGLDERSPYRIWVDAKLTALGAAPQPAASGAAR
jgi:predicted negative regulator of RcsB-dependent stress response